jgi:hypothetical protein
MMRIALLTVRKWLQHSGRLVAAFQPCTQVPLVLAAASLILFRSRKFFKIDFETTKRQSRVCACFTL